MENYLAILEKKEGKQKYNHNEKKICHICKNTVQNFLYLRECNHFFCLSHAKYYLKYYMKSKTCICKKSINENENYQPPNEVNNSNINKQRWIIYYRNQKRKMEMTYNGGNGIKDFTFDKKENRKNPLMLNLKSKFMNMGQSLTKEIIGIKNITKDNIPIATDSMPFCLYNKTVASDLIKNHIYISDILSIPYFSIDMWFLCNYKIEDFFNLGGDKWDLLLIFGFTSDHLKPDYQDNVSIDFILEKYDDLTKEKFISFIKNIDTLSSIEFTINQLKHDKLDFSIHDFASIGMKKENFLDFTFTYIEWVDNFELTLKILYGTFKVTTLEEFYLYFKINRKEAHDFYNRIQKTNKRKEKEKKKKNKNLSLHTINHKKKKKKDLNRKEVAEIEF